MESRFLAILLLLIPFVIIPMAMAHKNHDLENFESPFAFIEHLKGCHKGDKSRGILQLKLYLQKLCYLNFNASVDPDPYGLWPPPEIFREDIPGSCGGPLTKFTFTQVRGATKSDKSIGFNHGDGSNFDGKGGMLAHAFALPTGWFLFDAGKPWGQSLESSIWRQYRSTR